MIRLLMHYFPWEFYKAETEVYQFSVSGWTPGVNKIKHKSPFETRKGLKKYNKKENKKEKRKKKVKKK